MTSIALSDFLPIKLSMKNVGPFRDDVRTFDFLGPEAGADGLRPPCRLYLLASKNGYGKTTVIEMVHFFYACLDGKAHSAGALGDLDRGIGCAQLDCRGVWTIDGVTKSVVLSIWAGSEDPLVHWTETERAETADAEEWATVRIELNNEGGWQWNAASRNELGKVLTEAVSAQIGVSPNALFGEDNSLPTALYFPADRIVMRPDEKTRVVGEPSQWRYAPAMRFQMDGDCWETSIDNLFVWLVWLGEDRFIELRELIHEYVFIDGDKSIDRVDRGELQTLVRAGEGQHWLHQLSHGERALLQLFCRIFTCMTQNTVLLIDEVEIHLHPNWRLELIERIERLVKRLAGFSVICSTHEREIIGAFRDRIGRKDIVRNGYIIEKGM